MSGDIPAAEQSTPAPSITDLDSRINGALLDTAINSCTTESAHPRATPRTIQVKDPATTVRLRAANATTTTTRVGFGTSSSKAPLTPIGARCSVNLTPKTVPSSGTNRDTASREASGSATRVFGSTSKIANRSVSSTRHTTPTTADSNARTISASIPRNGIPEWNKSKELLERSQERIRWARNSLAVRAEPGLASRHPSNASSKLSSSPTPNYKTRTTPSSSRKVVSTHSAARNSRLASDASSAPMIRVRPTESTISGSTYMSPLASSKSIVNSQIRSRLKVVSDDDRDSAVNQLLSSTGPKPRTIQVRSSRSIPSQKSSSFSVSGSPARPSSSTHANGLGARTVSPTDARRRKQLSLSSPIQPVGDSKVNSMHSVISVPEKSPPIESKAAVLRPSAGSSFSVSKADSTNGRRSVIVSTEDIPPVPPLPTASSRELQVHQNGLRAQTPQRDASMRRKSSYVNSNGPATEPRRHSRQFSTGSRNIEPSLMPPLNLSALSSKTVSRVNAFPISDANVGRWPLATGVPNTTRGSMTSTSVGKVEIATIISTAASGSRTIMPVKVDEPKTTDLTTSLGRTLRQGANPSKSSLPGSPSSIPLPSSSVFPATESAAGIITPEDDAKGSMDFVPPSESPSAKCIPPKKRTHTTHTASSIRQKLTRTLKRPLENVHPIAANHDDSALFSSPPPALPAFSDSGQPAIARRHIKLTDPASPSTSIPSLSKRSLALARLAAFKDRAIAELSPTKSSPSSGISESRSTGVWIAEKELDMLDGSDDAAEQEMKVISGRHRRTDELARQLADYKRHKSNPISGIPVAQAVRTEILNAYEKGEILDFRTVYFCGTPNCCKIAGHADPSTNFGFDDERGDYKIIVGDHLAYRYEIRGVLGKGSFGQVVKCIDHKTGGLTAVKIIRNKKRFHTQALVETKILQNLCEWDPEDTHHFVRVTHNFYFRGHLCIATELLSLNLYEFVKENEFKGLSLPIIRRFAKQILSALCLLQRKKVIHCDLKPENILLSTPESAEIRVIDFGSSCFERERVFTYIQSRFYRSPEVILGLQYGLPIDMWSLGCILAELQLGYPIFPGENEQEQLGCIMEVFGPPENHIVERASRKKLFFDSTGRPRLVVSSKGRRRIPNSKALSQVLRTDDAAFIDFIACCLLWDPELRLKPDDAVRHPFISGKKMEMPALAKSHTASHIYQNGNTSTSSVSSFHSSGRVVGGRPLPELPKRAHNSSSSQLSVAQVNGMSSNSSQIRLPQEAGSAASTPYHSAKSTMAPNSRESTNSMVPDFKSSTRPPLLQPSKSFISSSAIHTIPKPLSSKRLSIGSNYVLLNGPTSTISNIPRITGSSRSTRVASDGSATPPGSAMYGSTGSTPASRARAS